MDSIDRLEERLNTYYELRKNMVEHYNDLNENLEGSVAMMRRIDSVDDFINILLNRFDRKFYVEQPREYIITGRKF